MHLRRIIFSMILSNLRVKTPITKKIENNIVEGMTSIYQNMDSKQFKHRLNLQHYFVYFESQMQSQITIKYKIDMSYPQKHYYLSFL